MQLHRYQRGNELTHEIHQRFTPSTALCKRSLGAYGHPCFRQWADKLDLSTTSKKFILSATPCRRLRLYSRSGALRHPSCERWHGTRLPPFRRDFRDKSHFHAGCASSDLATAVFITMQSSMPLLCFTTTMGKWALVGVHPR